MWQSNAASHFLTLFHCALLLATKSSRHTKPLQCLPLLDCSQWWQMSCLVACARPANWWCSKPLPMKALCIIFVNIVPFTSHPTTLKSTRLPGTSAGLQVVSILPETGSASIKQQISAQLSHLLPGALIAGNGLISQTSRGYTDTPQDNSRYSHF